MKFELQSYINNRVDKVEEALAGYCDTLGQEAPSRLAAAMRYSLLAGGKRLRPVLVLAGAEAIAQQKNEPSEALMSIACALEIIHTFSLIHDDLPAMDDDDLRRGRPTSHKEFGEGVAILAGDALLAEAFYLLGNLPVLQQDVSPKILLNIVRDVAFATGARGMTGGQLLDILAEQETRTPKEVERLHAFKTGALIRVSVVSGARFAGANESQLERFAQYGNNIGLAFQIADDLLSLSSTEEELGKPVGNDLAREKATYPAMAGIDVARKRMFDLVDEAIESLKEFGPNAEPLRAIAEYVVSRSK